MTKDQKDDIMFEVTYKLVSEYEQELSQRLNSTEFKMELKRRMEEKNVSINFVDMENTRKISGIEMDKYSVFVSEDFYEDLNNDVRFK